MTLLDILPSLRTAAIPRLDPAIWPLTTAVDAQGRITVGRVALTDIADEFRTPAHVVDEADFRGAARRYRDTLRGVEVVYAGTALLCTAVARWATEEGLGVDVCSPAELATALAGGVAPSRIVLHGNVKSCDELREAIDAGVGRIVVDSSMEIAYLAGMVNRRQRLLIRVTPDDDIADHRAVTTRILAAPHLELVGLHCHIGTQITDPTRYGVAIRRLIAAMADIRRSHGVVLTELNIGGGHGIPYISGDTALDLRALAGVIDDAVDAACAAERFPRPRLVVEPGRAISGRAGITLYRVSAVTTRPDGRTLVAVDGDMCDYPRIAGRGTDEGVALANRHPLGPSIKTTVVGRHCGAGDEIVRDATLPADVHPGDLLAVPCTGAYHHSMAPTASLAERPPLIAVRDGAARTLVRRETVADLLARDCG